MYAMLALTLAIPLLFASPETIIFSEPKPIQTTNIVTRVTLCIDEGSREYGYCFIMIASQVEVTLFIVDGSPVSLKMWNGVFRYTIWER